MTVPAAASHSGAMPARAAAAPFAPVQMMEIELTEPLPAIGCDRQHQRAWVLARLHTEPVGTCLVQLDAPGLTPDEVGARLWPGLRGPVTERFAAAGLPPPATLTGRGLAAEPGAWPFLRRRCAVLAAAPFISVVICTRDRQHQLAACLSQLDRQQYPRFEVVVVDNAPTSDAVRTLISARQSGVTHRYVVEPKGGLSWARNAGTAAASGEIVAFLDDDEEPDDHWLAVLADGFARGDDIGCVTGIILPARLDTPAQELFEQIGGHSKGRGFSAAVFSRLGPQNPLYPRPPFGAGGNMAFRKDALARIGGFDVALGGGTPALAGEDTLALTQVLLAGYRIAYEPAALIRHHHHRDLDGLGRQLHGYGAGLTAFYTALLRHQPSVLPGLLRLALTAAGYLSETKATRSADPRGLPARLIRRQRRGMLTGPVAYIRSVRRQAKVAASAAWPEAGP